MKRTTGAAGTGMPGAGAAGASTRFMEHPAGKKTGDDSF